MTSRKALMAAVIPLIAEKLQNYGIENPAKISQSLMSKYFAAALNLFRNVPDNSTLIALRILFVGKEIFAASVQDKIMQDISRLPLHQDKLLQPIKEKSAVKHDKVESLKISESGIFHIASLSKKLDSQGLLDPEKEFTPKELHERWVADRDVLLSMATCYAPDRMKSVSPNPCQLWMIRGIGGEYAAEDDVGPADTKEMEGSRKKKHASAAAWVDYFNIPYKNVITLTGERAEEFQRVQDAFSKSKRDLRDRELFISSRMHSFDQSMKRGDQKIQDSTKLGFVEQKRWDKFSEYTETKPDIVAPENVGALTTSIVKQMTTRLDTSLVAPKVESTDWGQMTASHDFTPVVLFVYGHLHADTDSIGGNSAEDIIKKLKWLGLEKLMSRTVTIVGLSCNSIDIVKILATSPEFPNAVMVAGTSRVMVPSTRDPKQFNQPGFFYSSYNQELSKGERKHQPLISDLRFSFKDLKTQTMGDAHTLATLAKSIPFFSEEISGLIAEINLILPPAVAKIVLDYFAYMATERVIDIGQVKPDSRLRDLINSMVHYEKVSLDDPSKRKQAPLQSNVEFKSTPIKDSVRENAKQLTASYTKKAANQLFELTRDYIMNFTSFRLGVAFSGSEKELKIFMSNIIKHVCEHALSGASVPMKYINTVVTKCIEKHGDELMKSFNPEPWRRTLRQ